MNTRLPKDLLILLALELDDVSLARYCRTNKRINNVACENDRFWFMKVAKEFPGYERNNIDTTWKEYYKKLNSVYEIFYSDAWDGQLMDDGKELWAPIIGDTAKFVKIIDKNKRLFQEEKENVLFKVDTTPFKEDTLRWVTFHDFANDRSEQTSPVVNVFKTKKDAVKHLVDIYYPILRRKLENQIYDDFLFSEDRVDDNGLLISELIEDDYTVKAKEVRLPSPFNEESMYNYLYRYGYLEYFIEGLEEVELWFVKEIKFLSA